MLKEVQLKAALPQLQCWELHPIPDINLKFENALFGAAIPVFY
jgi:hypothetical protein